MVAQMQIFTFPRKIFWLIRFLGVVRGSFAVIVKPVAILAKLFSKNDWYWKFVESQFDNAYKVDTVEMVPVEQLQISEAQKTQAVFYEPSQMMEFGCAISKLGINYRDYTFLDVGSGKGKTLMLASWFDFKAIVGIEISEQLVEIAERNINAFNNSRKLKDNRVSTVCSDAVSAPIPDGPIVIFLFNPFHEAAINSFLNNLSHSLQRDFRPTLVVYANPVCGNLLDRKSWLRKTKSEFRGFYSIYEAMNNFEEN